MLPPSIGYSGFAEMVLLGCTKIEFVTKRIEPKAKAQMPCKRENRFCAAVA
jgi:hypothetical protein